MWPFTSTSKSDHSSAFADKLAQQIVKRYPPELDHNPAKRPSINRLTRIIEEACEKAVEYQTESRLGWFGRARLANRFRWNLVEAGYTEKFAEFATEAMVVYMGRKQETKTPSSGS